MPKKARKKTAKKKAGNGRGSVCKRQSDGRWLAVISVRDRLTGKRRRITRLANTLQHANLRLRELQNDFPDGTAAPNVTIARLLASWMESTVVPNRAPATASSYGEAIENHVLPHLGSLQAEAVTPLHVREWLSRLDANSVGKRSQQNAFAVLNAALNDAVRMGVVNSNPCAKVSKPQHARKDIWPFTGEETSKVLDAVAGSRLAAVYHLGLLLGMRQGEIFGLYWDRIDFEAGTLRIDQAVSEVRGKVFVRVPKRPASKRTLTLDEPLVAQLRERRRVALKEGQAGVELVFPTRAAGVMRRSNFGQRHWRPLLAKLGIVHRGFHHTRHTAATRMLGSGRPVHEVAGILGHSKASTTLDIYAHWMPRVVDSVVDGHARSS